MGECAWTCLHGGSDQWLFRRRRRRCCCCCCCCVLALGCTAVAMQPMGVCPVRGASLVPPRYVAAAKHVTAVLSGACLRSCVCICMRDNEGGVKWWERGSGWDVRWHPGSLPHRPRAQPTTSCTVPAGCGCMLAHCCKTDCAPAPRGSCPLGFASWLGFTDHLTVATFVTIRGAGLAGPSLPAAPA
jgi:hypothetical protein